MPAFWRTDMGNAKRVWSSGRAEVAKKVLLSEGVIVGTSMSSVPLLQHMWFEASALQA